MKLWKDEEVKKLFRKVEECKKEGDALRKAFEKHANLFNRKPNSVRNYYYHEVDNLLLDEQRRERLDIDISQHEKNTICTFDEEEGKKLLQEIETLKAQGCSVRCACHKLANGNLEQMTRLQNKYQNMKKKSLKTSENNIIPFKQKQKLLTESDINSLFMGLVKLIKKTTIEDYVEKSKFEKESSSLLLKKALIDLNKKDEQIAQLNKEFEKLRKENENLVLRLKSNSKKQALKEHIHKKRLDSQIEG